MQPVCAERRSGRARTREGRTRFHVGYRVPRVVVEGGRVLKHEVFAEGWLQGKSVWGRPVDVEVMPDGSLLVSDDCAEAIYRIAYRGR